MILPYKNTQNLKILIIAHAFPPMNATASHRPYSWAKTWSNMGHSVYVLTTRKYPFDGSMDLNYDLSGIHLFTVDYLKGRNIKTAETKSFKEDEVSYWEKAKTLTRRFRFGLGMFADLRMLSLLPLIKKGKEIVYKHNISVIVSTYPPEVVHMAARWLSKKFNIPWVADYRDLWFQEGRLYQFRSTTAIGDFLNRRLLRKAHLVSTVSKGLRNKLRTILHQKVIVSYNGFIRTLNDNTNLKIWNDQKKHIVYTGRLYPKKRDPEMLFQALAFLRSSDTEVINQISIDFYGHEDPYLKKMVHRYGLNDCVKTYHFVSYQESTTLHKYADALLFLDWLEPGVEGILTGKLFEYLVGGRPIICIGNRKNTEAVDIIEECSCGIALSSVEEITNSIRDFVRKGVAVSPNWSRVEYYSRELQAKLMLNAISNIQP